MAHLHGDDGRILDAEEAFHQRLGGTYGGIVGAGVAGGRSNVGSGPMNQYQPTSRGPLSSGNSAAGGGGGGTGTRPVPPSPPRTAGMYGNGNYSNNIPRQTSATDSNSSGGSSGGGGSFWRTEAAPNWKSNSRGSSGGSNSSSRNAGRWNGFGGRGKPKGPGYQQSTSPSFRYPSVPNANKQQQTRNGNNQSFVSKTTTAAQPTTSGISTLFGSGGGGNGPPKNLARPVRQRKTSGGLTNAANAHIQASGGYASSTLPATLENNEDGYQLPRGDVGGGSGQRKGGDSSNKVDFATVPNYINSPPSSAVPSSISNNSGASNDQAQFKRMNSSLSQNSLSSQGKEKKDKQKAVSKKIRESRKIKMDGQFNDVDIGREVHTSDEEGSDGYIHGTSFTRQQSDTTTGDGSTTDESPLTDLRSNRNVSTGRPPVVSTSTGPPSIIGSPSPSNNLTNGGHSFSPLASNLIIDNTDNQSFASTVTDMTPTASTDMGSVLYGRSSSATNTGTHGTPMRNSNALPSVGENEAIGGGGNRSSSGGVLFGKSSSLIFPTGVQTPTNGPHGPANPTNNIAPTNDLKSHKINLLLDQCEAVRFPFKKKLMLNSLDLTSQDIPVKDLYNTSLGNTLHKLSLAGNRLSNIPPKLVVCLPLLKTLDLSQCDLHQLPERWDLKSLKRLNLSHNKLTDFPEEVSPRNRTKI